MQQLDKDSKRLEGEGASPNKVVHLHPDHIEDSILWDAFRSGLESLIREQQIPT